MITVTRLPPPLSACIFLVKGCKAAHFPHLFISLTTKLFIPERYGPRTRTPSFAIFYAFKEFLFFCPRVTTSIQRSEFFLPWNFVWLIEWAANWMSDDVLSPSKRGGRVMEQSDSAQLHVLSVIVDHRADYWQRWQRPLCTNVHLSQLHYLSIFRREQWHKAKQQKARWLKTTRNTR